MGSMTTTNNIIPHPSNVREMLAWAHRLHIRATLADMGAVWAELEDRIRRMIERMADDAAHDRFDRVSEVACNVADFSRAAAALNRHIAKQAGR